MAREKILIPRYVSVDMPKTATRIQGMTDEQLGAWFRKAVMDLCSGCIDPNTDPLVREQYERSANRLKQRQVVNARAYQRRSAEEKSHSDPDSSGVKAGPLVADEIQPALTPSPGDEIGAYGPNSNVMLTKAEGEKLRSAYGADLELALSILDSYLENNAKAKKKYKSHYAVLRRGNWVWNKVKETKLVEKKLENASKQRKSFQQQDLDARTEFFQTSVVDKIMEEHRNDPTF